MKKAIAILSAGMKYENGIWHSIGFFDDIKWGAPGGSLRVLAGSMLYKENPNLLVISCGGIGHDIKVREIERPLISTIIKNELIKLGVSDSSIIEENRSNTTFEALCYIAEDIKKYKITDISIISNKYHLERISEFIKSNKKLENTFSSITTNILSAEDIAISHDPDRWQGELEKIYGSKKMKERIKKEEEGVYDIKNNTYKY